MSDLTWNRYGKSRIRLVKVRRSRDPHELVESAWKDEAHDRRATTGGGEGGWAGSLPDVEESSPANRLQQEGCQEEKGDGHEQHGASVRERHRHVPEVLKEEADEHEPHGDGADDEHRVSPAGRGCVSKEGDPSPHTRRLTHLGTLCIDGSDHHPHGASGRTGPRAYRCIGKRESDRKPL